MKKVILPFLVLAVLFTSCEYGGISPYDNGIIENENSINKFRQLVLLVNIMQEDNYVILENIDSMKIEVNGKRWGIYTSEKIDTSGINHQVSDNFKVTGQEINYQIIAPYQLNTDSLETTGDYINYMLERAGLTPGDYICGILYLKIKNENEELITIKSIAFKDFTIKENTTSSFVGKISISIN